MNTGDRTKKINTCEECQSEYYSESSEMENLCPECSHYIYGYKKCAHEFEKGRCIHCFWNGNTTEYVIRLKKDTDNTSSDQEVIDNNYDIIWDDMRIGRIENYMPDMWYLEGTWVSDNTSLAEEFETLARALNSKETFTDLSRGIRLILRNPVVTEKGKNKDVHAVIISLTDNILFLRRIFDKEAVEWHLAKVSVRPNPRPAFSLSKFLFFWKKK